MVAVRWLLKLKKERHSCHGCHDCSKLEGKAGVLPMLCAGLPYGFTPCAPLKYKKEIMVETGEEGMVLAKNTGVLPLSKNSNITEKGTAILYDRSHERFFGEPNR